MLIDFHLHYLISQENFLEDRLRLMDEAGVTYSILQGFPRLQYKGHDVADNANILAAIRKYPDRFIGGVYIDPRDSDWKEMLDRYCGEGFRCVKMWPPIGYYPDEERFAPVYEYINERELPILFHAGLTGLGTETSSKYADPIRMEGLVRRYPKICFVLAHWGGYGFLHQAWSIATYHSNVYMDTAARSWGWPGVAYFNMVKALYPISFKRVVWGTDNIFPPKEDIAAYRNILKQIEKESFAEDFFGETAKKLLRVKK